jgi:hypothetical protein
MAESLKAQLAKLFPDLAPPQPPPAKHPPISTLDIPRSYARFCEELADKRFKDPSGNDVLILEKNFPKLLNLKLVSSGLKAKASLVLAALRSGTFDSSLYTFERDRIEALFWIPDVIADCHSLHPNCHATIEGDEVYVKVYDKEGDPIKILFTIPNSDGERVITTSFLTSFRRLPKFIRMPAIWTKK